MTAQDYTLFRFLDFIHEQKIDLKKTLYHEVIKAFNSQEVTCSCGSTDWIIITEPIRKCYFCGKKFKNKEQVPDNRNP